MIEILKRTEDLRFAIRCVAEMYNYDYKMIAELIKLCAINIKIKNSRK